MSRQYLTIVTPPVLEPVTPDEAKLYLKVDGNHEDEVIQGLIPAAREMAEKFTGRAFLSQTLKLSIDCPNRLRKPDDWWDGVREGAIGTLLGEYAPIQLPYAPAQSVTSVKTFDLNDEATTLDPASYRLDPGSARLHLRSGIVLQPMRPYGGMEITYVAGYGATPDKLPAPIRIAIKQAIQALYDSRDCADLPGSAMALLRPYRILSV